MSHSYKLSHDDVLMRLEVTGTWTPGREAEEVGEIWLETTSRCNELGLSRVLAIIDIPGRMPTLAAWQLGSDPAAIGVDRSLRIAVVYRYRERFESNTFLETVARNRGFEVKIFEDDEVATEWLTDG